MSLFELGPIIFGPSEDLVSWLRRKGLLSSSSNCARCAVPMVEGRRQDVSDGLVWRCRQCKGTKSIREGSFFSKSKLPLRKWVLLMHFWVRQYPVTDAGEECEVDKNSAYNVYRWFREVCSTKLLQTSIALGGPGSVVQVDESLFRHKPKVHFACFC